MNIQEGISIYVIYDNPVLFEKLNRVVRKSVVIRAVSLDAFTTMTKETLRGDMAACEYAVICANENIAALILKMLMQYGGCTRERIVDFYRAWNGMNSVPKVQKVMNNPKYFELSGMIMGLSHAETGIVSSLFPWNTCNIATGGQDIYYNLKCLEYCMEHHKNHLDGLQYVIFDMYDYSYFNFDTSLGKNALYYYTAWDGYLWDGHHFDQNKNITCHFHELQTAVYESIHEGMSACEEELFISLFPDVLLLTDYEEYMDDYKVKHITKVVTQGELDAFEVESNVLSKEFTETWRENEKCFEEILVKFREINPELKIYLVLLPRCKCIEERMEMYDTVLKPKFYGTLNKFREKYDFEILDFKGLTELSSHLEYYYDSEHLNRRGAEWFTKYLIEHIQNS